MNGKKPCILFVLSVMILLLPLSLFTAIKDEYFRKAALFKVFSRYIQWPEHSDVNDLSKPFVIGVIGKNPFGPILEKAYSGDEYKIKNKTVKIRFISKIEDIENCHILFISKFFEKNPEEILAVTRNKPILTIAETKGYAERGVLFNLYIFKNEIRFEINTSALKESQLIVDSQLLSFAKIINTPGKK